MFLDLRAADTPVDFDADVCIIGAGAAGIAIAREFLSSHLRVVLVESGGLEFDPSTQELYSGDNTGLEYGSLDTVRLRYFGGTTNHWLGMSAPLQPLDFEQRDWVKLSGWPISRTDLDPYYKRAHPILDLGEYNYDTRRWVAQFHRHYSLSVDGFVPEIWQISHPPTRLGQKYRDDIGKSATITALLYANITKVGLTHDGNRVDRLEVATLSGRRASIRARAVVLACGGIENARLLLASDDVRPNGVGNDRDMVGRCFMEHPELWKPAVGVLQGDAQWALAFRTRNRPNYNMLHLRPSDAMQRAEKILNTSVHITTDLPIDRSSGYEALSRLLRNTAGLREKFGDLWQVLKDPGDVADGVYAYFSYQQYVPRLTGNPEISIRIRSEQSPNMDSRVMLGRDRDALGMRRVELAWQLNELDRVTVAVALERFSRELGHKGLGRMRINESATADRNTWPGDLEWGHHHIGTTRMSDDPRQGVVDRNCEVHDVGGLYIAGSSVFPTGGYVNPTLTIVALAIRLADYLKVDLA